MSVNPTQNKRIPVNWPAVEDAIEHLEGEGNFEGAEAVRALVADHDRQLEIANRLIDATAEFLRKTEVVV